MDRGSVLKSLRWRLIDLLFLIVCTLAFFSCGSPPLILGPGPGPSATPEPTLPANYHPPLTATADGFRDASGALVRLRGVSYIPPDSKVYGWPTWISRDILEKVSKAGGNFVAVRLGPYTRDGEGIEYVAYDPVGDHSRVNLEAWNPAFWQRTRAFAEQAHALGIYVEFDMIDAWVLERPALSPWSAVNNVNGVDIGNCRSISGKPFEPQLTWVDKVMQELGALPNVLFQIGNETAAGNCTTDGGARELLSDAWELGIYERAKLGTRRPVGTNSHRPSIIARVDYAEFHTCDLPAAQVAGKPVGVNEWNCALTAQQFCSRQPTDPARWFLLWGDSMDTGTWEEGLKCLSSKP